MVNTPSITKHHPTLGQKRSSPGAGLLKLRRQRRGHGSLLRRICRGSEAREFHGRHRGIPIWLVGVWWKNRWKTWWTMDEWQSFHAVIGLVLVDFFLQESPYFFSRENHGKSCRKYPWAIQSLVISGGLQMIPQKVSHLRVLCSLKWNRFMAI